MALQIFNIELIEELHENSHNDRQGHLLEMNQSYYSCPCDRDIQLKVLL